MLTITGLIAVILVFLSGPYRTLQKGRVRVWDGSVMGRQVWDGTIAGRRWAGKRVGGKSWGSPISVYTHANVSLAAQAAVLLHVLLAGGVGLGLTWIGTWLFVASFSSGLYGFYLTKKPAARRTWLRFHRWLTLAFYVSIVPHVVSAGVLGRGVVGLIAFALLLWQDRPAVARVLACWTRPFRQPSRPRLR